MNFYLGTHMVNWLRITKVPLFVSRRRLMRIKKLPKRVPGARWALDSGGFSELSINGTWSIGAPQYIAEVRRYLEIGGMDWAAQQDWMCEPPVLEKTGYTVAEHQRRTVENYLELTTLAPDIHWMPVIQGWELPDYLLHLDMWRAAGVQGAHFGVGSVCRRQGTQFAEQLVRQLHSRGLQIHAFGVKITGLARYWDALSSADSMAWSFDARRSPPLYGHTHKNCANCLTYALQWRTKCLNSLVDNPTAQPLRV